MSRRTDEHQTWVNTIMGLYILTILEQGPAHGHRIASEIKCRTEGVISPNPNALYPLLRLLEDKDYIAGNWENPDTRGKRIYKITAEGSAYIPALRVKFKQRLLDAERKLALLRRDLLLGTEEDRHE